jgi:CubicO group peptidase (beta-lactamase class C family)
MEAGTLRQAGAEGLMAGNTGGFSEARLHHMHNVMAGHVEGGSLPGLVSLVSRRGEVHVDAVGTQAFGGEPMRRDTIFRIDSLTKPIAAVAAMILVEECVLRLDDPVDPWLPELADRQVLRRIDGPLDETVPADRPITLRDLLTLRFGLGYIAAPDAETWPLQEAFGTQELLQGPTRPQGPPAPDEWMRRLGALPLAHQPGEVWMYDLGFDVLGVLIARAAGQPLGVFMRERIFDPLGMPDTGFTVPDDKLSRFSTSYDANPETGVPEVFDDAARSEWSQPPAFPAAAGGLVSTAADLLVFGQVLLGKGRLGNERLLSRPSVETMLTDHITPAQKAASPFFPGFWDTTGWGFGLGITTAREGIGPSPGSFGWGGGAGTSWRCDPAEDMVAIILTQLSLAAPASAGIQGDFWTLAYAAIDD